MMVVTYASADVAKLIDGLRVVRLQLKVAAVKAEVLEPLASSPNLFKRSTQVMT